ncbi:HD domain-containing protein [Janibacter terrae]|uniref:HD domain-containing protein n=1 Tax=Janibacter terrae TaxID=103817 RepID=UPI00146C78D6|nr:metal-dependent phosphohydrolase [Janibacter terrae]
MMTLRERWHADVTALVPGADPAAVDELGDELLVRWREPHRAYHGPVHLAEVLAALDELAEGGDLPDEDRHLAELVAWFHDAVYETTAAPGASEEASAVLAEQRLPLLGLRVAEVTRVARLVRDSATHEMAVDDAVSRAFHDADLWILASPTERFDSYCAQVRAEYGHVRARDFAWGRAAVLTPFAERERLYLTDHAHAHWSARARVNLARELARLAPPA